MTKIQPPVAKTIPLTTTIHGIARTDPYAWLRADNWQEVMRDPEKLPIEIRTYLEAENDYFEKEFGKPSADLQEKIYREIRGRIKEDDSGIPTPDGPFAYFHRMLEAQQYPLLVRTPREGGDEEILLDCNLEAGDAYFGFGGASHDPTHKLLAWSADRSGSEFHTIFVRDLASGKDLEDRIERASGGAVWALDSASFYYTELDENHRPYRVLQHILGTSQDKDQLIYEEKDAGFFVGVGTTLSRDFITINAHDHQTSEVWLIDAHKGGKPRLVAERLAGREYDIDARHGTLFIRTNAAGAEDFKIVTVSADAPSADNWIDLVPHREGILILDAIVIANHLIRLERADGLPRIIVRNLKTSNEESVAFDEEAYSLGMSVGYEFDTNILRFSYSSPTTPQRVFDLNLDTAERTLRKEQVVPSGHNPDDYETRRIFADTADGERVPITLLFRKDVTRDATAPCLLYGYGAYGMSMPAAFSISALSLVDRGFVYATAHIRGGMEKGYRWYKQGRKENKSNTFNDFIAAAETLIKEKFVAPDRIIAMGGSAGGMLMGAIANLRPDLFAGIIAQVPFVDVLNTMLDDTLPLTPPEWPEWGNPIASSADYKLIASYSPYDNVGPLNYPPIFALAGLTDPRVTYWEPAKWVASLRALNKGMHPIYLKTNMSAGHGGASGRFDRLKETALTYAFAVKTVATPPKP